MKTSSTKKTKKSQSLKNNNSKKSSTTKTVSTDQRLILEMKKKFKDTARIKIGIKQVLSLWNKKDGDFETLKEFCLTYFIDNKDEIKALRDKLEEVFEKLSGHYTEVSSSFSKWKDLEIGALTPVDQLLSTYNPFKHVSDDFYEVKLPFVILLNF